MKTFYKISIYFILVNITYVFMCNNVESKVEESDIVFATSVPKNEGKFVPKKPIYKDYGVCAIGKHLSSYESGDINWDITSKQYAIMSNMKVNEEGHYVDKYGYYAVALGSYYGSIGKRFVVVFKDGSSIPIVKADEKSDSHTVNGCYHKSDDSIVEWILNIPMAEQYYGVSNANYVLINNRFKDKEIERIYEVLI